MALSEFTACTVCGSNLISELNGYEVAYLCKCSNCSFVFAKKIPTESELIAHYETYPRTNSISSITIKRYNELLDTLEKFRNTNNLIDVGCGDGFFLETAKHRNWNVYGTEYTDQALKICKDKGIHMHQGKLDATNYPPNFFDVITSFEVIEHINNPKEELQHFSKILRKGGVVYVTTPNFNSVSRYSLKSKWNVIEYPEHLSYYTQKTLSNLFLSENFSIDSFQTTGISLSRFQKSIGQTTTSNSTGVSKDEELRNKTETKLLYKLTKKLLNFILTMFRAGDTLKGLFIKK